MEGANATHGERLEPVQGLSKKVPLAQAIMDLSRVMDAIDNAEDIDLVLTTLFDEKSLVFQEAVDRRIMFSGQINQAVERARNAIKGWQEAKDKLEAANKRFEERTKQLIESTPQLKFRGSLGTVASQKNPQKLDVSIELKSFSVGNVLSATTIAELDIDPVYIDTKIFHVLNRERLKADLQINPEIVSWAKIVQNTRLVIKEE